MSFTYIGNVNDLKEEKPSNPEQKNTANFTYIGNSLDEPINKETSEPKTEKSDEESPGTSRWRTLLQFLKGVPLLSKPIAIGNFLLSIASTEGKAEALDDLEEWKHKGYINDDEYKRIKNDVNKELTPTLGGIYKGVEEKTGIPLEAKEGYQKNIEQFSEIAALRGGEIPQRLLAGVAAPMVTGSLENKGMPEPLARLTGDITALGLFSGNKSAPQSIPGEPPPMGRRSISGNVPPGEPPPQNLNREMVPVTPSSVNESMTSIPPYQLGKTIQQGLKEPPPFPTKFQKPPPPTPVKYEPPAEIEQPKFDPFIPKEVQVHSARDSIHLPEGLDNDVGNVFINRFEPNNRTGGGDLIGTIENIERPIRDSIKEAYDNASKLIGDQKSIPTELVKSLVKELNEIQKTPEALRTTVEKKAIPAINSIIDEMTQKDPEGNIQFIIPIKDSVLHSRRQEISDLADYEFINPSGKKTPTGEFKRLVKLINEQLEKSAKDSKNIESYEAIRYANNLYKRTWAEPFQNDQILPYRSQEKNINHASLFEKSINIDTFKALQDALRQSDTAEARNMEQLLKRNLVSHELRPYITNPEKINETPLEFREKLREISSAVTSDELRQVEEMLISRLQELETDKARVFHETKRQKIANQIRKEKHKAEQEKQKFEYKVASAKRSAIAKKVSEAEKKENASQKLAWENEIKTKENIYKNNVESWKISTEKLMKLKQKTPEQLVQHGMTVSGLHDIGYWMSETEKGAKTFETTKRALTHRMLSSGKNEPLSPDQILKVLNDTDKKEFLIETMGPKNVHLINQMALRIKHINELVAKKAIKLSELKKSIPFNEFYKEKLKNPHEAYNTAVDILQHPATFTLKLLGKFFKYEGSQAEVEANNADILKALVEIDKEINAL